ncbi:hypothetical protein AN958_10959 [Leucoagaricus sp. SymC.cos]|nr:hypothetical protein AN958_10959 [Leucoagaricus sp. SymC.cos]
MTRAFFLAFAALLYASVSAAPAPAPEETIEGFGIGDIINLLGIGLVTHIHTVITVGMVHVVTLFVANMEYASLIHSPRISLVKNPLPIELTIDKITSSAGVNGTEYARFTHTFPAPGFVIPPLGTKNSGTIDNVLLTQGAAASLDIIPLGELDLLNTDANIRAATIAGHLGIPIPLDGLKQSDVPTT